MRLWAGTRHGHPSADKLDQLVESFCLDESFPCSCPSFEILRVIMSDQKLEGLRQRTMSASGESRPPSSYRWILLSSNASTNFMAVDASARMVDCDHIDWLCIDVKCVELTDVLSLIGPRDPFEAISV